MDYFVDRDWYWYVRTINTKYLWCTMIRWKCVDSRRNGYICGHVLMKGSWKGS